MTTLPPPPNGGFNPNLRIQNQVQQTGDPKSASVIPLVVAVLLIIISLAVTFITRNQHSALPIYILGYIATPLAVGLCMGWDSIDQRKKTKADPWFIPKSKYSLILRILTAISFFAAFPHISEIARSLSQT